MYKISKPTKHDLYGFVIEISKADDGSHISPFRIIQEAFKIKRVFLEIKANQDERIRYLINDQVYDLNSELDLWAKQEYDNFPKCQYCFKILPEKIEIYQEKSFCSTLCLNRFINSLDQDFEECCL